MMYLSSLVLSIPPNAFTNKTAPLLLLGILKSSTEKDN